MYRFNGLCFSLIFTTFSTLACDDMSARKALKDISWLTEDYPPFNYSDESGKKVGIFTEVLFMVYQKLGIEFNDENITVVPWARLYRTMEVNPRFAAYSMVNTPQRQNAFILVPLPILTKNSIMVLKKELKRIQGMQHEDLTIAVVREDIGHHLLNSHGFPAKQIETTSASSMLKMLAHERVDAIAYAEEVAFFQLKKLGLNKGSIVPIIVLDDQSLTNYVFHKDTPTCVVNLFRKAVAELEQSGELELTKNKYLRH
jgi:polar amino acid transport system substrate-binding protein